MISDVVVDSCVVAKWVLPEADSDDALDLLRCVTESGRSIHVLDIALIEVGNVLWKNYRRRIMTADGVQAFLENLLVVPVTLSRATPLLPQALRLATRYDHPVYDCLFIALMRELDLPGITADAPLYRAVRPDTPGIRLLGQWRESMAQGGHDGSV